MLARPWYKSISLELCCSVRWVLRLSWPAVTSTHPDTVTTALSRLPVLMDGQNTNPILSCALNPLSIQRLRVAETLRSSLLLFEDLCPVFLLFSRVFSFTFCPQRVKSSRRIGCHVPALSQLEVLFKMLSRTTAVWACISCQRAHTPTPLVLAFLRVTTCQLWRRQVGGKCQVFVTFI